MCFVDTPKQQMDDPGARADAEKNSEMHRRRRAQGYGATLLTTPQTLGSASLGRATLGGR